MKLELIIDSYQDIANKNTAYNILEKRVYFQFLVAQRKNDEMIGIHLSHLYKCKCPRCCFREFFLIWEGRVFLRTQFKDFFLSNCYLSIHHGGCSQDIFL